MFTTEAQRTPRKEKGESYMLTVIDTANCMLQITLSSPVLSLT